MIGRHWSPRSWDTTDIIPAMVTQCHRSPQGKKHRYYPLVICYIAIENGPVEIVDFPIENGDFP